MLLPSHFTYILVKHMPALGLESPNENSNLQGGWIKQGDLYSRPPNNIMDLRSETRLKYIAAGRRRRPSPSVDRNVSSRGQFLPPLPPLARQLLGAAVILPPSEGVKSAKKFATFTSELPVVFGLC